MNDLIGFIVALAAQIVSSHLMLKLDVAMPADTIAQISEKAQARKDLSFGWQRAKLLGAFFNGVFLLALGISILLQSIERFITIERESL